ncbi:I78 family peptidase inhibitor [Ruegeria marina]|uniref:Peptidase inhibitor I78 family protein n=1 Tax=Ruegeria marina TaxID=639004 RepID=A0A1G6P5T2_9RHOB|nr:I78 family peptidase inhibitor [Ruegeria marina]SDC75449.1 Peptidase inhibitor I78 family protein [Ruegeria marina]
MYRATSIFLLLAACSGAAEQTPAAGPAPLDLGMCGGEGLEGIIGQPVADVMARLPDGVRVIGPDTVVTQDYRPDRLNVTTDEAGTVTGFACG